MQLKRYRLDVKMFEMDTYGQSRKGNNHNNVTR